MSNPYLVSNCMHTSPVTVSCDEPISAAIKLLMEHKITGLTVLDDQGKAVGEISELDCLKAVLGQVYNEGSACAQLVRDHMKTEFLISETDQDIIATAQSMLEHQQRRRPVLKNGELVGQLSCRNILWAVMEYANGY